MGIEIGIEIGVDEEIWNMDHHSRTRKESIDLEDANSQETWKGSAEVWQSAEVRSRNRQCGQNPRYQSQHSLRPKETKEAAGTPRTGQKESKVQLKLAEAQAETVWGSAGSRM